MQLLIDVMCAVDLCLEKLVLMSRRHPHLVSIVQIDKNQGNELITLSRKSMACGSAQVRPLGSQTKDLKNEFVATNLA